MEIRTSGSNPPAQNNPTGLPQQNSPGSATPRVVLPGQNAAINFPDVPGQSSDSPASQPSPKIRTFGAMKRHEDQWSRTPNTTGSGAIHVKSFHAKLTEDSLTFLDQSINEWLDNHPQYEVKFISTTIGEFTGKIKEPHLICMVWV